MKILIEYFRHFEFNRWYISFFPKVLVCSIRGHKLVDCGYATPDSGCIQMMCNRCGYTYPTHWLY